MRDHKGNRSLALNVCATKEPFTQAGPSQYRA
jgi:hypothetical protein